MNYFEWFEKHDSEYLEFERIKAKDRLHKRQDLCAMLYLHDKFGGKGNALGAAGHDEVYLDWDLSKIKLTEEDVIYLLRCGVLCNDESLVMFV